MTPTVGRIVLVTLRDAAANPMAAIVTAVHGSGETPCINATVFPSNGAPMSLSSVSHASIAGAYATWDWMPYQKDVAAAAAERQARIDVEAGQ